jgi:hypothetical protein
VQYVLRAVARVVRTQTGKIEKRGLYSALSFVFDNGKQLYLLQHASIDKRLNV